MRHHVLTLTILIFPLGNVLIIIMMDLSISEMNFVQFCFVFEMKNATTKSRMPITRSKRTADPMISLSAVKRRRIAKDVGKDVVNEEHGTSKLVNEIFSTGIVITSDETAKTYEEIFESLEVG